MSARRQRLTAHSSRRSVASIAAAALLAAGSICWSAAPLAGGQAGTRLSLIVAIVSGVMSIAQLATSGIIAPSADSLWPAERVAWRLIGLVRWLPWADLTIVATLALEALHSARPWHTAVLGIGLTGYLLAAHLTESGAGASVLRAQLPLLAAGIGLTGLAVAAAALPAPPAGPGAALIRVAAVVIAVIVAGMVVPAWLGRGR
ncbi:MAG TPA: hypothetical protein VMA32_01940 [Streptosporangiaceae bacterium]|nr:hypothetical protein [Streptosporangiaceae bacterium]